MTRHGDEEWLFRVVLPADIPNAGRYAASIVKWLGRRWHVRCVALEESAEVKRLRKIVDGLAARVAAQAELLARRAERLPTVTPQPPPVPRSAAEAGSPAERRE